MAEFYMSEIYGGGDANKAVGGIGTAIKKQLGLLEKNDYSTPLEEFGFKLFVAGQISRTKESPGFSSIRISEAKGTVAFNVVMDHGIWEKGPAAARKFLRETIQQAFESVVEKADKKGIPLDGDKLVSDVSKVLKKI